MGKTSLNEGNSFNGLKEIRWCYDTYIKGRKEDIVRLAKKEKIGTSQIKNCKKNNNIISFGFKDEFKGADLIEMIRSFPELMICSVVKGDSEIDSNLIAVVLSDRNYPYLTEGEIIGNDATDDRVTMEGFEDLFSNYYSNDSYENCHSGIAYSISVNYHFPYLEEWNNAFEEEYDKELEETNIPLTDIFLSLDQIYDSTFIELNNVFKKLPLANLFDCREHNADSIEALKEGDVVVFKPATSYGCELYHNEIHLGNLLSKYNAQLPWSFRCLMLYIEAIVKYNIKMDYIYLHLYYKNMKVNFKLLKQAIFNEFGDKDEISVMYKKEIYEIYKDEVESLETNPVYDALGGNDTGSIYGIAKKLNIDYLKYVDLKI